MQRTSKIWVPLAALIALMCAALLALAPAARADDTAEGTLTLDTAYTVVIDEEGEIVYLAFTPSESGLYTFSSLDEDSLDTYGYLYDSSWEELASDDDSAGDWNFAITSYLEGGSTYYLGASFLSSSITGSFDVIVSAFETTELDLSSGAVTVACGEEGSGWTYYSFTAPTSDFYVVTVEGMSVGWLDLYDATLTYLADGEETVCAELEAGETYYLAVYPSVYDDDSDETITVSLAVALNIADAEITFDQDVYYYDGENEPEPSITVTYEGVVLTEGEDYTFSYEFYGLGEQYAYVYGMGDYAGVAYVTYTVTISDEAFIGALTVDVEEEFSSTDIAGDAYYTLAVDETGWYTVTVTFVATDDTYSFEFSAVASVYDSDWNYVTTDISGETVSEMVSTAYLTAGETYYVDVYYSGFNVSSSEFSVLVEQADLEVTEIELDTAYSLSNATSYYTFTPDADGTYIFTLEGTAAEADCSIYAYVYQYDESWVTSEYLLDFWAWADYAGDICGSSTTLELTAGETYCFTAYGWNESGGSVTFTVTAGDIACTHNYELTESVDATCTEDGYEVYTCTACGESYTVVLAATGHSYEAVVTAPTCEEGGYTTYTCSVCGDTYVDDETDALGHDWQIASTTATCTEPGTTVYVCANDESHTYTEEAAALGHDYQLTSTTATCTEAGVETYACSRCDDTYTVEVGAYGHNYDFDLVAWEWAENFSSATATVFCANDFSHTLTAEAEVTIEVTTPATCVSTGVKTYTATATFVLSGTESENVSEDAVATASVASTISADEGTASADVETVTVTTTVTEVIPIDEDVHDYDDGVYTAPTCTEDGYTTYTCAYDESHSYVVVDEGTATGHTYGDASWLFYYTVSSDGTVTFTQGVATFTCRVCGDEYTVSTTDLTVVENEDGSYTVTGTVAGPDGQDVTGTAALEVEAEEEGADVLKGTESDDSSSDSSDDSSDDSLVQTGDDAAFAFVSAALMGCLAVATGLAARRRRVK